MEICQENQIRYLWKVVNKICKLLLEVNFLTISIVMINNGVGLETNLYSVQRLLALFAKRLVIGCIH